MLTILSSLGVQPVGDDKNTSTILQSLNVKSVREELMKRLSPILVDGDFVSPHAFLSVLDFVAAKHLKEQGNLAFGQNDLTGTLRKYMLAYTATRRIDDVYTVLAAPSISKNSKALTRFFSFRIHMNNNNNKTICRLLIRSPRTSSNSQNGMPVSLVGIDEIITLKRTILCNMLTVLYMKNDYERLRHLFLSEHQLRDPLIAEPKICLIRADFMLHYYAHPLKLQSTRFDTRFVARDLKIAVSRIFFLISILFLADFDDVAVFPIFSRKKQVGLYANDERCIANHRLLKDFEKYYDRHKELAVDPDFNPVDILMPVMTPEARRLAADSSSSRIARNRLEILVSKQCIALLFLLPLEIIHYV
jgi:hypothetical protein